MCGKLLNKLPAGITPRHQILHKYRTPSKSHERKYAIAMAATKDENAEAMKRKRGKQKSKPKKLHDRDKLPREGIHKSSSKRVGLFERYSATCQSPAMYIIKATQCEKKKKNKERKADMSR